MSIGHDVLLRISVRMNTASLSYRADRWYEARPKKLCDTLRYYG